MDPTETLRLLQDAYLDAMKITAFGRVGSPAANAWNEVLNHAENLLAWLNNGGFPPKNHTRDSAKLHIMPMMNAAEKHVYGDDS